MGRSEVDAFVFRSSRQVLLKITLRRGPVAKVRYLPTTKVVVAQ
jgi:hypothetical protein